MQVPDLKDQLRTYYESTTEPIDIDGFIDALLDPESEGAEVIVGPFGTRTRSPMPDQSPTPWYRSIIGLAAAILTVIAIGIIAFTVASGPDDEVADEPTTVTAPSTTMAPAEFTEADALAVVEEYFEAFERGNVKAMTAVFAEDVALRNGAGPIELPDWVRLFKWKVASETMFTDPSCETRPREAQAFTVICNYEQHEYLSRAVNGPAVPHLYTATVTPGGIAVLSDLLGTPNFNVVDIPFETWMTAAHPDEVDLVSCCGWVSDDVAEQHGRQRIAFADEWADYLEENQCTYDVQCVDPDAAVRVVRSYFDAYDIGDYETMRAVFAAAPTLADAFGQSTSVDRLVEFATWDDAQGAEFGEVTCEVRRQTPEGAEVVCELADQQFIRELVGAPPVPWTYRAIVNRALQIATLVEFIGEPDYTAVNAAFSAWVRENHPGAADLIEFGWNGVDEATAYGNTRREYAELWAAYLEENGCTWDQPCEP